MSKGNIYLVNMEGTDLYKIGYTKRDITKRLDELKTGNPNVITCVHLFETEHHVKIESWLHNIHSTNRMEGEWFELTNEDVRNFKQICQKGHDMFQALIDYDNPFI